MSPTDDRGDIHGDEPGPSPGSGGEAGAFAGPDNVSGSFGTPGDEPRRTAERENRGGRERRDERDREREVGRERGVGRDPDVGRGRESGREPEREAGHSCEARSDRDVGREREVGRGREAGHPRQTGLGREADHLRETRPDREAGRERERSVGREPEIDREREVGRGRETRHPREAHPAREAGHAGEPDQVRVSDVLAEGVRGADPAEIPGKLCVAAVRLLPVADASVSLRSNGMPVQLSSSSARAAHLADLQATLGDGPCTSAAKTRAAVLATDLTSGPDADRWPVFAQQAVAAGVRAVYAMPLGNDTVCVGTLDLYRDVPGGLTRRELRIAELVASVMTVALTALVRGQENGPEGDDLWLSGLGKAHDEVYQAVGMIMVQLGVDSDEALARLRADAFADSRTAPEVAHDIVWHLKRFDRD
ncbi:GAF and ANTAR domain-containing protein [Streptomyces sviceus]|uniref:GAF and ANTAR domain-containing protein n=1 Tax=Streptomyces sviceus TaxID=285530 RepID=UPI0036E59D30